MDPEQCIRSAGFRDFLRTAAKLMEDEIRASPRSGSGEPQTRLCEWCLQVSFRRLRVHGVLLRSATASGVFWRCRTVCQGAGTRASTVLRTRPSLTRQVRSTWGRTRPSSTTSRSGRTSARTTSRSARAATEGGYGRMPSPTVYEQGSLAAADRDHGQGLAKTPCNIRDITAVLKTLHTTLTDSRLAHAETAGLRMCND